MEKLITFVTSFTPQMNCSVVIKFILILSMCGVIQSTYAQTDNSDVITKMPEKSSGIKYDVDKNTKTPPESFGPALIRNVPADFATIQAAINGSNNGDIILIAAGTYREDITLNKYLKIRGANYGINPNTGTRVAETIIQPATSDPDPYSPTYVINFYIGANGSGSIIDGITFDGDNPTLTSGVTINGADIDAAEGIAAYDGMSNLTISNNILKNINYAAIDLDNYTNAGASTYDNFITDNLFDNMNINAVFGISVLIYDNCYASITDNVMTRVRIGVQTGNFSQADLSTNHSISNNTIQSYRLGIFHNLAYTYATAFTISNNVITTVAGAPKNVGIEVASMQSSVGATVTDNNVTGARYGYSLWNCPTTNTITVSGGTLTNCNVGVFPNNYDGYNSNADPSIYAMTGITMTNCDTAIWIRDNNLNSNSATVALNINNTTNIVNGTGIGLLIEGGDASVSFSAGDPIDFNTNLSKYIQLITNGSNVPAANINAQEVEFGGTKGNASTNSQLFAIEDKIDHKIDWNSVGFVTVKANNSYVTTNSFYPPNTTFASIQNGIDIAVAGDTVNAGSGTYNEVINLNKAITLNGNGPGNTILAPAILVCPIASNGITITSSNVNVNNLTVSNYNYGITTSASTISLYNVESINNCLYGINTSIGTNGLTLLKCKLNNNIVGGWRAGTGDLISNILIDSSEVKGNGVGVNNGFGIFLAASTPAANTADNITIRNSDFSNNLKKGMYFEKLRNALIDNVVIDNCGTDVAYGFNNGIDINLKYDSYSNITVQNCSITNSGVMGTATDVNNPCAITVKARDDSPSYNSDPATLTGFTMKNCFVSGPVNGLRFGEYNKTNNSPTGNTVIENNFGGAYSNKAIVNKTANTISVSCNWYGSAVPANVIAMHGSGLNYIPYLTNGNDDQPLTPGFQIVPLSCNGMGPVKNITQVTSYPTIQLAVNAANNGDIIEVDPGTYNEQVLINKEVTIKNSGAKPVIDFTGTPSLISGKLTLFEITVPNVKIESLEFKVDLAKLGSAIIASAGNINNLSIKSNDINPYKSGTVIAFGSRNAVNINYGTYRINSSNPSNILAENNTISYNFYGTPNDPSDDAGFRSGFATDEGGGTFNLNTIQTISQDIEARFGGAGDINITNNNINGGGVNLAEYNPGAGNINVTGNTFNGAFGNTYSSSLRLKNNQLVKTTVVSGNTFQNHNWGISLENYRAVTIDNNTFTPAVNSTVYRHITVNTKLLNSSSATVTQTAIDGTFTNNTFNQSGTSGGTGMAFYNHDSDNDTYGTFTIGGTGNENDFNNGIALFIALDPSTGPSWPSAFPENNLGPTAITTMACWDQDLSIQYNNYDVGAGLQLPSAMNYTQRSALESNLYHKPDNSCLGNLSFFMPVHNLTQNTYFMNIQPAVIAAVSGDVIECEEYTYNERVTIDKSLTIQGVNKTNCKVDGTGLGNGKGIEINAGITNVTIKRLTVQNFAGSSGNADGGIYATGGNNYLYIESVIIQNNVGGSGFYANGPVNTVTLDSVTSSGHSTGARGIVIWNGLKENITFTNCEVFGNNCCGMELQDGQASGVTIENNNIHDNADNGMGLLGMQGPGENIVKGNTLLNNGRFGIEIKNPNGTGLTTGPGRIVVENNNVSRSLAIGLELRDIAGIAAFRRSFGAGNVDIPTGVVIQNNTVAGYIQPSTSDGFGIVVEGMNHTVSGNTVSSCDVGIQRQAGHLPYPGDGDASNLADTYFGRGNSPQTCGVIIGVNTLTNTLNTRDVGSSAGGFVTNLNTALIYCSIQAAINDPLTLNGHVIEVGTGTYNERVVVSKQLTIQGTDKVNCKVDGTGLGNGKGIEINAGITNVTIKRLTVQNFAGSSGNADGGIYATGGNNYLYIESVIIQNNVGGSGFYANGPVNTVTLDSVISSGHSTGARGIVIWNGLKENITFTNCEVFGNNCCGMELQDGQASGVTIENNNIHDNADNGMGLLGMQGPGENIVKGNTLLNNGRFGIEIKNPNGTGLTTGPGRIVVENNNVSRSLAIGLELRDIAGIAAFRRSFGAGNVDIPTGVVIQNNTVAGYIQPSTSDGFGIVVEGMNHTVSGNTVSSCDVGIQRQAGHLPYPGDGDASNLADTYFGRGNSPQTCGVTLSGNILTNTVNTRDVSITGEGVVENINSGKSFCSIQSAIDDSQTQNGDVIDIDSATYNESVVVSKEVTLLGNGGSPNSRPTVEGVAGQSISVTAPNVTINNLIVKFNQGSVLTGIKAAVSGSFNNLTVKNSCVFGTGITGAPIFGSAGLQLGTFGGVFYDQVNLDSNEIKHTGTSPLGRGVKTFNCFGDWKRSSITGFYSIQSGDIQGGILNITEDSLKGETEINSTGTGTHSFSNNICNVANAYGPGTDFALLELKNLSTAGANLTISGNTFQNYVNFGIFSGRSNNVTIDNNTFTPDPTSVVFRSIRVDTKQRTTAPQTAFASGAVIIKNTFNGNAAVGQAGNSVELANSDNISSIGTVTLGGPGNENNFNTNVSKFISLNNETASTSGDPVWTGTYVSTKGKVTANVNGISNYYNAGAGLQLPSAMLLANLFTLEDKIQHKIDDLGLGFVLVNANNDYVTINSFVAPVTTTPSVQRGIDAASAGFTVNVDAGSFTEQLEVNKDLTIDGQGSTLTNIVSPNVLALSYTTTGLNKPVIYVHDAADVIIKDLTVDGAGKGNANNRFQGIAYRNAGGTLRNCDIKAVRNTPIDGVQAGVGLYAYADDGNARKLNVIKNAIFDFQKNATVFAGADLTAKIDSNTITGAGAINFTAQNGIQLSTGAAGSIRYNTISNLSYTPSTVVSCGVLLFQSSGPDTTSNNVLTACQMGIYYYDVGGVIRENTVSATAANTGTVTYYGINADPGAAPRVKIQPADIQEFAGKGKVNLSNSPASINTSIFRNTLTSDGTNGTGIEMDALGTQTLNASVMENKVNGWDAAVVFYKDAGATLNGTVNDNNLSNNVYALYNLTGVLQNCTCNWYGTIVPATISSKISGIVNSSPYLTNGTDFNAAPGFQPVPGSCNGILAATLNIKVIQEGFYNTGTQTLNKKDTVRAYLHLDFFPYSVLDSSVTTVDSVTFTGSFSFSTPSGNYYIVVKHRNCIETWSKSGGETFTAGATMNYDFTDAVTEAYQNNLVQVDNSPVRFAIFSGDVNQDGVVDGSDISNDENDVVNASSGYISTDVTGDDYVDASDLSIIENNSINSVSVKKP